MIGVGCATSVHQLALGQVGGWLDFRALVLTGPEEQIQRADEEQRAEHDIELLAGKPLGPGRSQKSSGKRREGESFGRFQVYPPHLDVGDRS